MRKNSKIIMHICTLFHCVYHFVIATIIQQKYQLEACCSFPCYNEDISYPTNRSIAVILAIFIL